PRCPQIIGSFEFRGVEGTLPSLEQQRAADGGTDAPDLMDVVDVAAPIHGPPTADAPAAPLHADNADTSAARDVRGDVIGGHGDATHYRANHCSHPRCEFDNGHAGPHSHELAAGGRGVRRRSAYVAHIVTAVVGDTTGCLAAVSDRGAYPIAVVNDGDDAVFVAYNTMAADSPDHFMTSSKLPTSTREALGGPQGAEWLAAYQKDYAAKVKNKTFTLVPRPKGRRVIPTKVAHAYKREDEKNGIAITELRARWVGMGFRQGLDDFNATYCATPNACSVRLFASLILFLGLYMAKSDVTKAFTLNPIDVEMYVEQMPGMETKTDASGRTWPDTKDVVCLLHKCLEGLKQSGNVWQQGHSAFCDGLVLPKHNATLRQSQIEPTLFIAHCGAGILAILVWVDDLWIAFSAMALYEEFVSLYAARFPSKHNLGCTKFAGICIDYKRGQSMTIHQRPHIELAYNKFVTDKVAAAKSPAVTSPAVADRNSPRHYSKLHLAANDDERQMMKGRPYLAALATLMYKVHFTSAHLNYHTSFLGQFMHDPSPPCWDAVIDLIIYDYHNRFIDIIVYGGEPSIPKSIPTRRHADFLKSLGFHCYSDASWLLRSPAGYFIFMCNGPVDWAAKLIRVICHSSAEAEIAAGCMMGKRIVYITGFLSEFNIKLTGPAIALIDNTAADDLTKKFGVTPKTAHFQRWQHYLRYLVAHNYVEIVFVGTSDQLADILTKVVDISTFLAACRILFKHRRKSAV
ncbi:MAG: hypothetical protein GWP37_01800, partial [Gammaproteobacteria bacterium]|nr:hypothetical protein [Gammaproteobacteria bacterium]